VFEAGNRTDGVYAVVAGRMELRIEDPETGQESLREIGVGEHFGDRLIMGEPRRIGTVRALEDSTVLVMDRDEFLRVSHGFAAFRRHFSKHLKDTYDIDWTPDEAQARRPV
jgi:NADH dehydrogenase